jgi:hypothetical protein
MPVAAGFSHQNLRDAVLHNSFRGGRRITVPMNRQGQVMERFGSLGGHYRAAVQREGRVPTAGDATHVLIDGEYPARWVPDRAGIDTLATVVLRFRHNAMSAPVQ